MTAERERILQKIRRVQALAERGVAGEQESAAATLDRLVTMSGLKTPGRVVDKLVREKMLALRGHTGGKENDR